MVYSEDISIESFNDLCIKLAKHLGKKNYQNIKRNINSTVRRIDILKAKDNFYNIFHINFDDFFITPKHLTILLVNTFNRIYKN